MQEGYGSLGERGEQRYISRNPKALLEKRKTNIPDTHPLKLIRKYTMRKYKWACLPLPPVVSALKAGWLANVSATFPSRLLGVPDLVPVDGRQVCENIS